MSRHQVRGSTARYFDALVRRTCRERERVQRIADLSGGRLTSGDCLKLRKLELRVQLRSPNHRLRELARQRQVGLILAQCRAIRKFSSSNTAEAW